MSRRVTKLVPCRRGWAVGFHHLDAPPPRVTPETLHRRRLPFAALELSLRTAAASTSSKTRVARLPVIRPVAEGRGR